jgi:hypothetical protein
MKKIGLLAYMHVSAHVSLVSCDLLSLTEGNRRRGIRTRDIKV